MKVDTALITEGEEDRGEDIRTVSVLINRFIALPFSATAAAAAEQEDADD